jgi:peptide/nickel transport system permease protein
MPYDPNEMDIVNSFQKPSFTHILGTDNFGRDIFSRILKGSQTVFFIGAASVLTGFLIGSILGLCSGYMGSLMDTVIMRFVDAQMAFPGIMLALVLITVLGSGIMNISLALGLMAAPKFCRIIRSACLTVKDTDYVKAAKARGTPTVWILLSHIAPNIASPVIATATIIFSFSVLSEAGLSYLGLGIEPPGASWGKMLFEAQSFLLTEPWYAIIPGVFITMMTLSFNMLGEGLRDITDVAGKMDR